MEQKINKLIKKLSVPQVIRPKDALFKQIISLSFKDMYYIIGKLKENNIKIDGNDTFGYVISSINKNNIEEEIKYCEYCGKEIEDTNDTGTLCHDCYMKEYYGIDD